MKIHPAVVVFLSIVIAASARAGESQYNPHGAAQPSNGQTAKPAPPQEYSYYCYGRSVDGTTEYRTDIMSEPTPHDAAFINRASEAWIAHLGETFGKYKAVGQCSEGPTASAKPAWERVFAQPRMKTPVLVDWQFH